MALDDHRDSCGQVESMDPDPFSSSWKDSTRNRAKQTALGIMSVLMTITMIALMTDPNALRNLIINAKDA